MEKLIIVPTVGEFDCFVEYWRANGFEMRQTEIGRIHAISIASLGLVMAIGGLGKVQMAVHTQHMLDMMPEIGIAVCAGAGGSLLTETKLAHVVVSTEIIEHDIRKKGSNLLPRFSISTKLLEEIKHCASGKKEPVIHFGPIASGDEDIWDEPIKQALHDRTGAIAVGWEGAGLAKACTFSGRAFLEIRGIADNADRNSGLDFKENLGKSIHAVASLLKLWGSTNRT
jgi:adenosylhomocysteine nucleosidase